MNVGIGISEGLNAGRVRPEGITVGIERLEMPIAENEIPGKFGIPVGIKVEISKLEGWTPPVGADGRPHF